MFRVLSPSGEVVNKFSIEQRLLVSFYRNMVLARVLDSWLMRLQRMGKVGIHAPSEGQEAVGVGTAYSLERDDWIFPLYRELPVYIARGVPLEEIINRYLANSQDPLKGSDFAVYGNIKYRIVPAPVAVGLNISVAVGFSLALKHKRSKEVVMNYFGEGATSKGEFHEALNFAGVFKAPVVFVCTNNQYAISTPFLRQTASTTVAEKAIAYGFQGVRVDGNDVVACYLAAKNAVDRARRGEGPTLLEAVTYRIGPHTTADDPARYRSDGEVEEWRRKDPIERIRRFLISENIWSVEDDRELWMKCEEMVKEALERCERIPPLNPSAILDNVYSTEPWHLAEQKKEFNQQL